MNGVGSGRQAVGRSAMKRSASGTRTNFRRAASLAVLWVVAGLAAAGQAPPVGSPEEASASTLRLTLKRAVEIAVQPEGSARLQVAREMIRQSQARSAQARAALLPDVSASVSEQNQTRNLAALGIRFEAPPSLPGFQFPHFVGPFTTFDARTSVTQNVLDISSIRRFQASRAGVGAARAEADSARDGVIAQVARAYLAALRAGAALDTARANLELSEALLKLATAQKNAGTGTGIDVTRARVQLANDRQRLLVAESERTRAHLELLKAIGLRMNVELDLADALAYEPGSPVAIADALQTALRKRPEWQAQQRREQSARLTHSAVTLERLPSVVAFGDYGTIGGGPDNALPTRTYGLSLRVPVFDGGRRDARRAESASQVRQEAVRSRDLRDQIEMEIRIAADALRSADAQVTAAREGLDLAQNELAQARRRYEAGVTSGLELTDAQTRLARASENQVNALFNHNLARIEFAAATGTLRELVQ